MAGRIIPAILAISLALAAGLRLLSLDAISFRAWEVLTQYAPYDAPFEANHHFRSDREFGDLANLGNLPRLRECRAGTTFTTDSLGFRNRPGSYLEGPRDAILIGDSYAVGSTVADEETLAATLGALSGCAIYNAAGGLDLQPPQIIALAQHLGMRSGLVIDVVLEGAIFLRHAEPPRAERYERLVSTVPKSLGDLLIRLRGMWTVSPLKILIARGARLLEDDRILPNSYGFAVLQRTLRDGQKILFVRADMSYAWSPLAVSLERWTQFNSALDELGLTLVVVLVPRKYTVYQPLLAAEDPLPSDDVRKTLAELELQLRDAGIPVVNVTSVLRAQAARDLDRGGYIYWRDDTHWNAHGIAAGAERGGPKYWATSRVIYPGLNRQKVSCLRNQPESSCRADVQGRSQSVRESRGIEEGFRLGCVP